MATQQIGRQIGRWSAFDSRVIGLGPALVLLVVMLVAALVEGPQVVPARIDQPVVGQAMVVTAPVWDGTTYRNVPIQVGTPFAAQPVVGQAMVVTAPMWDGTAYQSMPVRMGKH